MELLGSTLQTGVNLPAMKHEPGIFDLRDENCTNFIISLSSILRVLQPGRLYTLLITRVQERHIHEIIEQSNTIFTSEDIGQDLKIILEKKD